ncbi:hypothetical protein RRG08_045014 [Elysia crispata]|uniref:Uncharacterized protein n=1 Tax=Elysia crispata TaxID=231223 RepID=A0AAE0Y3S5_9GAST|nr:hypothetical protein RRG08_045014 [Elysia crispata]
MTILIAYEFQQDLRGAGLALLTWPQVSLGDVSPPQVSVEQGWLYLPGPRCVWAMFPRHKSPWSRAGFTYLAPGVSGRCFPATSLRGAGLALLTWPQVCLGNVSPPQVSVEQGWLYLPGPRCVWAMFPRHKSPWSRLALLTWPQVCLGNVSPPQVFVDQAGFTYLAPGQSGRCFPATSLRGAGLALLTWPQVCLGNVSPPQVSVEQGWLYLPGPRCVWAMFPRHKSPWSRAGFTYLAPGLSGRCFPATSLRGAGLALLTWPQVCLGNVSPPQVSVEQGWLYLPGPRCVWAMFPRHKSSWTRLALLTWPQVSLGDVSPPQVSVEQGWLYLPGPRCVWAMFPRHKSPWSRAGFTYLAPGVSGRCFPATSLRGAGLALLTWPQVCLGNVSPPQVFVEQGWLYLPGPRCVWAMFPRHKSPWSRAGFTYLAPGQSGRCFPATSLRGAGWLYLPGPRCVWAMFPRHKSSWSRAGFTYLAPGVSGRCFPATSLRGAGLALLTWPQVCLGNVSPPQVFVE